MEAISRHSTIIFLLCFVFLASNTARGSQPMKTVLENGMIVVLKENHVAPVVSLHVYVKAGSIYEREYLGRGISHNLEHLMSNGTEKRSKDQIDRMIEDIGNVSNAYTTKDHTSYYITTASSYFDTGLDILSDYIQNPQFPEEEVESERGVIINEINMGKDSASRRLYNLFFKTMLREHPARLPVIGYRELFEEITREDIQNYYNRMYVPNNMVFVAVGDFDKSEALSKIKEAFKDFKRGPMPNLTSG